MTWTESNLVFLVSLPRSGSTLLQRLLGTHPDIVTTSETWLLLPLLYALRHGHAFAEYSHMGASSAIRDFCATLPERENTYYNGVREFSVRLFQAASPADARYFVEKTPRNTLVIDRLVEIFPRSRFIFLWRNPLACAASMIDSFSQGRWNLFRYAIDLHWGLDNMLETSEAAQVNKLFLRYEDLVARPHDTMTEVLSFLGLDLDAERLNTFNSIEFQGRMGDPTGTRKYSSVSTGSLNKWQRTLANPLRRKWAQGYLRWLGEARLSRMGYDAEMLRRQLADTPVTLDHVGSDLVRMVYGTLDRRLQLRQLRQLRRSRATGEIPYEIF